MKKLLKKIASFFQDMLISIFDSEVIPSQNPHEPEPTWTKDSSFALVIATDYRQDTYPVYSVNRIRDNIMSECADTVKFIVDKEATAEVFLDALREGIQYKTFFFYENAHGNNKCIRMADRHVKAQEVWDILKNAENRIVGFFDSCYSGSMIVDPNPPSDEEQSRDAVQDSETMADYLVRKFNEQDKEMRARGLYDGGKQPQIRLYSAGQSDVVTLYEPTVSTKFSNAIISANKKTPEDATYADFDKKLIELGSYKCSVYIGSTAVKEEVIPQIATYGKDFSDYRKLR